MAVFKCKMCGGTLDIQNESIATCEYCGTKQTLPRLDDDHRANLYDRANHLRRNNEFDKAAQIYEKILTEDSYDAEAYWSLVLCRYGIEYVEDPSSHKRVPTVNRAQYTSVFDDDNYKSAVQHADSPRRRLYEEEAKAINEIQKNILAISQKEEPFDVFICYKESDAQGRRTPDSVLANDLYHQLTVEGFKVFYSRITLEDKLGSAYEPYIFAALNSAKVMIVMGTKPEYFSAVWVKNEWSRYLSLIKQGQKKLLIPAYKDMDPYDLPEEFSHLQAQDMSKLGFMQDLIRGIKKITQTATPNPQVVTQTVVSGSADVAPLLKRALIFLEDGEWDSANDYCEKVLDMDPENAMAYVGKLMCDLRVHKQEDLGKLTQPFDNNGNYQKAVRFADDKFKPILIGYTETILRSIETARCNNIYQQGVLRMNSAHSEQGFAAVAEIFESIAQYKDAATLAKECRSKAEIARKDSIYSSAKVSMNNASSIVDYQTAGKLFSSISGWKDADEQAQLCRVYIEELKQDAEEARLRREREAELARQAAEKRAARNKKILLLSVPTLAATIALVLLITNVIIPFAQYQFANSRLKHGHYVAAYETFIALEDYKDSADKAADILPQYHTEKLKVANIGDVVCFGSYKQTSLTDGNAKPLKWIVLDKQDNSVLLISEQPIECMPYHNGGEHVDWKSCSLRKWLNTGFLSSAFTADEQACILTTSLTNADTNDQVFLLTADECDRYFPAPADRKCSPTPYATINGVSCGSYGHCSWWLRTDGGFYDTVPYVNLDGSIRDNLGISQDSSHLGVRPVIWVDPSALGD